MRKYSCLTILLLRVAEDRFIIFMDDNGDVDLMFLNFAKAFDIVNHILCLSEIKPGSHRRKEGDFLACFQKVNVVYQSHYRIEALTSVNFQVMIPLQKMVIINNCCLVGAWMKGFLCNWYFVVRCKKSWFFTDDVRSVVPQSLKSDLFPYFCI